MTTPAMRARLGSILRQASRAAVFFISHNSTLGLRLRMLWKGGVPQDRSPVAIVAPVI